MEQSPFSFECDFFRSVLTKMNAIVREDLITETAVTQVRVKCSS